MRPVVPGVWSDRGMLWTRNAEPGRRVYGERLRTRRGQEFRNWNPYRSKVAALLRKVRNIRWPADDADILYLGAASGTTVSHLSDIVSGGCIFAVEFSPRSLRDLLWNTQNRQNVIPILEDARHPERYAAYLDGPVDWVVQDVAQRDQVDIFVRNAAMLKRSGRAFLFVKARSIDVAKPLRDIYTEVTDALALAGFTIEAQADLDPFQQDHRAFVLRWTK